MKRPALRSKAASYAMHVRHDPTNGTGYRQLKKRCPTTTLVRHVCGMRGALATVVIDLPHSLRETGARISHGR